MRDHRRVVPEEFQSVLGRWCAGRVPDDRRDELQIGYTIQGDEVTIVERHPPKYPELGHAWTSTPVCQLRYGDPEPGLWSLYLPTGADDWQRADRVPPADRPEALLDAVQP
jgi:hypothetical protein